MSERQSSPELTRVTPIVRGLLAESTGSPDAPYAPVILTPAILPALRRMPAPRSILPA